MQCDARSKRIKDWMNERYREMIQHDQLDLAQLSSGHFQEFLVDLRDFVSISVLNGLRSSLFNMYQEQQADQPIEFKETIGTYHQALKRKDKAKKPWDRDK